MRHFCASAYVVDPKTKKILLVKHKGFNKWVQTGGHIMEGETPEEAALREVYEETKVKVTDVKWFAYYIVHAEVPFCKAVFTARVETIEAFVGEFETVARHWLTEEELLAHPNLSFYMRDDGMKKMLQEVKTHVRQW